MEIKGHYIKLSEITKKSKINLKNTDSSTFFRPFHGTSLFLHSLKTKENHRLSDALVSFYTP